MVAGNSDAVTLNDLQADTQYQLVITAVRAGKKYRSRPIVFRTLGKDQYTIFQSIITIINIILPQFNFLNPYFRRKFFYRTTENVSATGCSGYRRSDTTSTIYTSTPWIYSSNFYFLIFQKKNSQFKMKKKK